jgi:hypothetical protein
MDWNSLLGSMDSVITATFSESISYQHGSDDAVTVAGIWTDGDGLVAQPGASATLDALRSDFDAPPQPNDTYVRGGKTYKQIGPVTLTVGNWMHIDLRYISTI